MLPKGVPLVLKDKWKKSLVLPQEDWAVHYSIIIVPVLFIFDLATFRSSGA